MSMRLHRYWFEFEGSAFELPPGTAFGCGVTAWSEADALRLLQERALPGDAVPEAKRIVENVDVSALDARHVRPNMGVPSLRGVWFPLGYEEP
jgi:hypothetical protein